MKPRHNFRPNILTSLLSVSVASLLISHHAHAASATWNGTTGVLWSTTTNWTASPVPGTGDTATFNNAGNGNTTITTGTITISTILFDTANAAAYILGGTTAGTGQITLNDAGGITINSAVVNNQVINANVFLGANRGTANYTFTNNSTTSLLTVAGSVTGGSGGASGSKTLIIAGSGNTLISGLISQGNGTVGLTKTGLGVITLSNASSSYSGTTTISAGTLAVGANAPSGNIGALGNTTSAVVLGNGATLAGDAPSLLINGAFTVGRAITVGSLTNTAAYNATIGGSNTTGTSTFSGGITLNTTAANYTVTLRAATGGTVDFTTGTWTTNNKAIAIGSSGNTGTVKLSNALATTGGISVNFGTFLLGASDRIGDTTPVTVAGGIFDTATFTDTVGTFNMSSGTLKMAANQTGTAQLVSNGVAALGSGNTIDLTGMATTAGIYRLVSGSSLTGTFGTITGLNSNYLLRYGAATLDAQRKADQTITGIVNLGRRLSGTTLTGVTLGTLNNTSVTGSTALAVSLGSTAPGDGSITGLASSSGSTVGAALAGTITGNINVGTTVGAQTYTLTNTDANAITTTASNSGGAVTVVDQRSFSVGTTPIALGRFLASAPSGTTAISSSGLNAVTANATLGGFSTVSGLTLTTGNSTIFNGGVATQTANYTVGGTATVGAISGTFSSAVTAELGSISNVTVGVTGTALNQRTFTGPSTVNFGRVLLGTALNSGTVNVTTSGLNAVTASSTLGTSTSGTINGLSMSGAATLADGSSSPFSIGRTVSGTLSGTAGTLTGTFNMNATDEFSNVITNAASVSYTVNGVATRTVNSPTTTALGNFHAGATVNVTSNAFGYTYGAGGTGANSDTENTNVLAYGGAADANGITLSGGANAINSSATFTRTFTGTATINSSSGSFSSTVNPEFSSATTVSAGYTIGVYSGLMVWGGGSGTYAAAGNWTDSVAGGAPNAPGLDAGYTTTDTATFNGSGGTVALGGSSPSLITITFGNSGNYTITTTGGTIALAGSTPTITATGGSHIINAAITGTAGLTKAGAGTVTLNGANTYTGPTTITAGTLIINGSTSTGIISIAANATFGGTGTVGGNIAISGLHSPGNSPGIQTFTNDLSYVDGGTPDPSVLWELNASTTVNVANPNAVFDQIVVGGNLDFTDLTTLNLIFNGSGSTVDWSDGLWSNNQSWLLYDVAGTTSNFANLVLNTTNWSDNVGGDSFNTVLPNSSFSLSLAPNGIDVLLIYTVPEPRAALLGAIGLLALLRRRR